jgi:DNA polymerase III epsilon subunit-like protein
MKHPILRIEEKSPEIYEVSDLFLGDLSQLRLWLFDLEATGLDTSKERVTQIAGIPIERGRIVDSEAFVQLVNPGEGVQIPAVVQELTGIKPEMLRDAPSFAEAWPMCERAAGAADVWIGQSVFEFDVPLLHAELARHHMPPDLPPILDSVVMATHLLGPPENRWSTSALIEKFSVDITGLRRHDAPARDQEAPAGPELTHRRDGGVQQNSDRQAGQSPAERLDRRGRPPQSRSLPTVLRPCL